jgi:hypothetical protein
MIYAIEKIGYDPRARYAVKAVTECGTNPTNGKAYRTEDDARRAAAEMGLTVSVVGDLWQILHVTH